MSQTFPITPSSRIAGPYTVGPGQATYIVDFPFQYDDDLSVQWRAAAGQSWTEVDPADYSVTGAMAAGGGSISYVVAPATNSQVRIVGAAPISQTIDALPANSIDTNVFNTLVDRLAIWCQETRRDIDELDATGLIEEAQAAATSTAADAATVGAAVATATAAADSAAFDAAAAQAAADAAATSAASINTSTFLTKADNLAAVQDKAAARNNLGVYSKSEVEALIDAVYPIGTPSYWPGSTPPTRHLERNGATLNIVDYPDLYAVLGTLHGGNGVTTFALPDDRGLFDRAWDHGRGLDSGRVNGSQQADEFKAHTHSIYSINGAATSNTTILRTISSGLGDVSGSAGGAETRPVNRARLAIIRAW